MAKLKELNFESVTERLKVDILVMYVERIMNTRHYTIADFAHAASESVDKQALEGLIQERGQEVSQKLMDIIHSMFDKLKLLKQNELLELTPEDTNIWIVKDDALKMFKDKNFDFLKTIINQKKTSIKLFIKLKELFVKVQKIDQGKIKDTDIDYMAKKLNDFEKARSKIEKEKTKQLQKEDKKQKPEPVEKKSQSQSVDNEKEQEPVKDNERGQPKEKTKEKVKTNEKEKTKEKAKEKIKEKAKEKRVSKVPEATQKIVESDKPKKNMPSIQNFFTKVKHDNITDNSQNLDKYNRYNSIGTFKTKIINKEKGYTNFDIWAKDPSADNQPDVDFETKFYKRQKPLTYRKDAIRVRFIRFEDYMKEFTEYKGYLQPDKFSFELTKYQLVRYAETFNYDLLTDDELQLLDAESCSRSNEESDEEAADTVVDDFLVPDDYVSDEETDSVKKIKQQREQLVVKMNEELKTIAIDFKKLNENDFLVQKYKVINLTGLPYPLPVKAAKPIRPEDTGLDDALFARIVLLVTGMQTKKDVYKLLCEKGIDISKKILLDKIFESAALCYYVEPAEFETYVTKDYYDTLITSLRDKNNDIPKESSTYMERLILLTHGSVSNAGTREEKIYRDLKAIYPQVTKQNLDKTIKRIAQVGYIFYPELLERLVS